MNVLKGVLPFKRPALSFVLRLDTNRQSPCSKMQHKPSATFLMAKPVTIIHAVHLPFLLFVKARFIITASYNEYTSRRLLLGQCLHFEISAGLMWRCRCEVVCSRYVSTIRATLHPFSESANLFEEFYDTEAFQSRSPRNSCPSLNVSHPGQQCKREILSFSLSYQCSELETFLTPQIDTDISPGACFMEPGAERKLWSIFLKYEEWSTPMSQLVNNTRVLRCWARWAHFPAFTLLLPVLSAPAVRRVGGHLGRNPPHRPLSSSYCMCVKLESGLSVHCISSASLFFLLLWSQLWQPDHWRKKN